MNAIAAIFASSGARLAPAARLLPGETPRPPLEAQGIAGGGASDVEEMLLDLHEKSFYARAALRVQTGDMGRQPLARVEITDLALMIVSGRAMQHALAARAADRAPVSTTLPPAYRQGW